MDEEFYTGFSFPSLKEKLESSLPATVRIFKAVATNIKYVKTYSDWRRAQKSNLVFTTIMQTLAEFSQKNNLLKKLMGMYLFATGSQRQSISAMHHLGLSESYQSLVDKPRRRKRKKKASKSQSTRPAIPDAGLEPGDKHADTIVSLEPSDDIIESRPGSLRALARNQQSVLRRIASVGLFGLVYNNINIVEKAAEQILGRTDAQENGTCATLFVLWAASIIDLRASKLRESFAKAPGINMKDIIHTRTEAKLFRKCLIHCILRIFLRHGGASFDRFSKDIESSQPSSSDRIEVHKTELHPMPTWKIDESTIVDLHGKPDFHETVRIIGGDQLSIARMRSLVSIRAGQEGGFNSFSWGAWMPGLFHAKIADTHGFFTTHWGKANTGNRNPGSLWFHNTILHRLPITLTSLPTFRVCRDLIFTSLYARVLNCLLLVAGCDSLEAVVKPTTTFQDLLRYAEEIYDRFTDAAKVSELRWERRCAHKAGKDPKKEMKGDMIYENAILFLRDALITREFSDAVKCGDSGRVMLVLKIWALEFRGNGRTKYAYEMLSIVHHITHVWPEPLRKIILNNWLLNPTGNPNSFVEVDLVQKHMNFWIKNFYRAHGSNGSWEWLEKIAPCVVVLRNLTKGLNGLLGSDQGTKHAPPDLTADIQTLIENLHEREVYMLKPGCMLDDDDPAVIDSITAGLEALSDGLKGPINDYNQAFKQLQARSLLQPLVLGESSSPTLLPGPEVSVTPQLVTNIDCAPSNPLSASLYPENTNLSAADSLLYNDEADNGEEEDESELVLLLEEEEEPTLECLNAEDVALDMDEDMASTESDLECSDSSSIPETP
ncbi:hypothetical protein AAF712_013920 [Marasmius tenuissimus]|uniref:DUF6589 domain-containing protein n=1 Tax=Marasmius tenuissimus TaxID=585030 RepID=A0ABR2ZCF1_9AGAR